jgi:hypothetical protein
VLTPNLPGGYDASMVWTELLETPLLHSVPGGGVANFEHQAFVEFYASLHLAQVLQTDPARFVRRAELRVWQETLQTLVGYQTEQTKDAVQEFLRLTPDLHLDLVVGCLLSAEHIEPEVLATVVDRLKQTLNDRDEPMPQRAAAAEALLALARLSDSEDVVTALLANLAGPDVCADVVRILISHQAHVSPRQRQELFSHVERLLITGEEAVVQACVEVLGQDDSALAGAVTLAPITRPSSVSALARRALVRRLADEYRLPWATLRKLGKDADPGVRFAALSALARVGQSAGDTAGSALAATVESDPGLFPELAGLMTELPPGFFAPDAERWTRLALEHCNRAGADNNALADLAEVVILKASQATQGARLLSQLPHATAARLSLRFWLDVIALSEIDVGTRAEVVRLVVRSLPSRWPPPDSKLMHELLSAISGNQQLETSTAEPLWSEYRNQVPPPSGPRLTADRAAGAIDRLQSASADVALRAWLDLCRPLPDRILIDLARDVDLSHRSALRRISLLGYHSVGSNLPHEALFELHQRLVTTSRPGPLIAAHADHFGARAIRYGFDVLAKQGYFARNPAARLALFRPALRQLPPRADSFSHFIAQSIAQSQIGVIKATIGDSDDRDLPICAASSPRIRYRAVPASPTACSAGT